jgi:hypothetical protein
LNCLRKEGSNFEADSQRGPDVERNASRGGRPRRDPHCDHLSCVRVDSQDAVARVGGLREQGQREGRAPDLAGPEHGRPARGHARPGRELQRRHPEAGGRGRRRALRPAAGSGRSSGRSAGRNIDVAVRARSDTPRQIQALESSTAARRPPPQNEPDGRGRLLAGRVRGRWPSGRRRGQQAFCSSEPRLPARNCWTC